MVLWWFCCTVRLLCRWAVCGSIGNTWRSTWRGCTWLFEFGLTCCRQSITSSKWSLSIFSTEGWLLAWQGFSVILTCKICGDNPVCGLLHSQARFPKYRLPGQWGLHRANLQSTKLRPEGPPACWLWRERGDFKHRQAPNPLVAAALTAPNWTVEVSSLGSL